jgi:digeranylgeranylglycerophospholipid reductase
MVIGVEEREAVVVGAGPAGAAAAFFLKRADPERDVLVLERLADEKYSRYHRMCGQAISRAAFRDLSPLRPQNILHRITHLRDEWSEGNYVEFRSHGYVLDRPSFLRGILDRFRSLGGQMETATLGSVAQDGEGTLLHLTDGRVIRACNLIAADGSRSLVRKALFKEEPPVMLRMEQCLVRKQVREDTLTFRQEERYQGGYRWEFPAGDLCCVGFPRGTDIVEGEIVERHRRNIPIGGVRCVEREGVYLVGDAAAMANPVTWGGIRASMISGRKAAEAIASGRAQAYQKWWERTPLSPARFMGAYACLREMTNDDYHKASKGISRNPLTWLQAYLTRGEYRPLYDALLLSLRYGW